MATRVRPANRLMQAVIAALATLGFAHFVLGFRLMLSFIWAIPEYRLAMTIFSLPYAGLALLFLAAFVIAMCDRLRVATFLLAAAFLLSGALCAYDLTHGTRAQIVGRRPRTSQVEAP